MYHRRIRPPFSMGRIALIALLAAGLTAWLYQRQREMHATGGQSVEVEEKKGAGLWPEEWFFAVRNYPDGVPSIAAYTQAMQAAYQQMQGVHERGFTGFSAPWRVVGPYNIGARINTIKVHPTDPNTIYIGYSGGGVWKTIDGGKTWNPIFDKQRFLAIGDIELDPQNPNIVYVGTGDPNVSSYPFIGDGLWRSPDGGRTWQAMGLEAGRIITKIIPHPTQSNTLYVAVLGLPFQRTTDRGVYKTVDGGRTWQKSLFVSDQSGIIDMEIAPNDPNTLYAVSWDRVRNNRESMITGPNGRVWKTTNGGQTWAALENGLPTGQQGRIGLAIDGKDANHLVASYITLNATFSTIYETRNAGQQWSQVALKGLDRSFQSDFAWYFGKIYINPFVANDVWALGVTSWRSTDGGANWEEAISDKGGTHVDHHDLAFVNATTALVATDGGLYKTDDNAKTWVRMDNVPTTQLYRVAFNPFRPDWSYAGAQDNGTIGGNQPNTWTTLFWGDGFQAAFHPEKSNIFYYEWQNGGIVGTTNGGAGFASAAIGIESTDRRHWDMQYFISKLNTEKMYTGTFRAYEGTGHPPAWKPISPDLTDGNIFGARFHTITTLDENAFEAGQLYVGTTDGNVWRGQANTESWTNISNGLPDRYVSCVKASPNNANRVFASFTGYRDNDFQSYVYRSDNKGASWQPIGGNLPALSVNDIYVMPGYRDSVIFVGTDGGVYGTTDGGKMWERLGTGMPIIPVYDLDINTVQRTLIAGSHARSVFTFPLDSLRLRRDVSTNETGDGSNAMLQLSSTTAQANLRLQLFNLRARQTTQVYVYDLQGRPVWQTTVRNVTHQQMELPIAEWSAGLYVAFAQTEGRFWGHAKFVVVH